METMEWTSGSYFKSIKVVHAALVIGVVLFLLITVVLDLNGFASGDEEIRMALLLVASVFTFGGVFAGNYIFKKRISIIREKTNLREKMDDYRSALIVKWALIEGPAFLAVVAFMLTGDLIFFGIGVLLVIVFLVYTPSRNKFIKDLSLSPNEVQVINDLNSVIN
jgi:hypothetical protein